MTSNVKVTLDVSKLNKLKADLAGNILASVVDEAMLPMLDIAKIRVPVKTGNLRASIHREITLRSRRRAEGQLITRVIYGPRIEFGFNGPDSLGRVYHQAPRPYMRPAFDEGKDLAIATAVITLRDLIGGIVKRG